MHTEDDLRTALLEFADQNEPDTHAVRAEIESRLTDTTHQLPGRSGRLTTLVSVAACIAVVIALAIGVHLSRSHSSTPASHKPTPVKTVLGLNQFPGTTLVARFHGTGPQTIQLGNPTVPAGYVLSLAITCHGRDGVAFGGASTQDCLGKGAMQASLPGRSGGPLLITVGEGTAWQAALVIEPQPRTNAMMSKDMADIFKPGNTGLSDGSGQGNGTVRLTPEKLTGTYTLWLECSGTGVTITSTTSSGMHDDTQTCWPGWGYSWDVAKGIAPTAVHVAASPGTTWTLAISP